MDHEPIGDGFAPEQFISYARVRATEAAERDPLVGDIVHFFDTDRWECQAALVVAADDIEPVISVVVFDKHGTATPVHGVRHDETKNADQHWHWPEGE